jgi:hypothetical protein
VFSGGASGAERIYVLPTEDPGYRAVAPAPGGALDAAMHIDLAAKGSPQIKDQCAQIDGGAVGIEVDEEVEIALGRCAAPRYRAKEPDGGVPGLCATRSISVRRLRRSSRVIEGHRRHSLRPDHGRHGRRERGHDSRCGRESRRTPRRLVIASWPKQ